MNIFPKALAILFFLPSLALALPTITGISANGGGVAHGPSSGGSTINIIGTDFGTPGTSTVEVLVDGNYCQSSLLVALGEIQCLSPAGIPGLAATVRVFVDSVEATNTEVFTYFPEPFINSVSAYVEGYGETSSEGSPFGGDRLLLKGADIIHSDIPGETITVLVDGEACTNLNAEALVEDNISCTVPSTVNPGAAVNIDVLVDGVPASNNGTYQWTYWALPDVDGWSSLLADDTNPGSYTLGNAKFPPSGGSQLYIEDTLDTFAPYYTRATLVDTEADLPVQVKVGGQDCNDAKYYPRLGPNNPYPSHSQIICTVPAGTAGTQNQIEVFLDGNEVLTNGVMNPPLPMFGLEYLYFPTYTNLNVLLPDAYSPGSYFTAAPNVPASGGQLLWIRDTLYNSLDDYYYEYNNNPSVQLPPVLSVSVGGVDCPSATYHQDFAGLGEGITCVIPEGVAGTGPNSSYWDSSQNLVTVTIDGTQAQYNYNPTPQSNDFYLSYYDAPNMTVLHARLLDPDNIGSFGTDQPEGPAVGNTILQIEDDGTFDDYYFHIAAFNPGVQPELLVKVGGKECTNPRMDYDNGGGGEIICDVPAGIADTGPNANNWDSHQNLVELWIDGVKATYYGNAATGGNPSFYWTYWPTPDITNLSAHVVDPNNLSNYVNEPHEGPASGNTTLRVAWNSSFQPYVDRATYWDSNAFPEIDVTVDGNVCTNVRLDGNYTGDLLCEVPAGTADTGPNSATWDGNQNLIELWVEGVKASYDGSVSSNNDSRFYWTYWPLPDLQDVYAFLVDPNNANNYGTDVHEGPASGGTTMQVSWDNSFQPYIDRATFWNPEDLSNAKVHVGGKECSNLRIDFNNSGEMLCEVPAGSPNTGPNSGTWDSSQNIVELWFYDVKASYSGSSSANGDNRFYWTYWAAPDLTQLYAYLIDPINPIGYISDFHAGPAEGGTTLQLKWDPSFNPYNNRATYWDPQAAMDIEITVAGNECTNPRVDTNNTGDILCQVPAGIANTGPDSINWLGSENLVVLKIDGVSATYNGISSANGLAEFHWTYWEAPGIGSLYARLDDPVNPGNYDLASPEGSPAGGTILVIEAYGATLLPYAIRAQAFNSEASPHVEARVDGKPCNRTWMNWNLNTQYIFCEVPGGDPDTGPMAGFWGGKNLVELWVEGSKATYQGIPSANENPLFYWTYWAKPELDWPWHAVVEDPSSPGTQVLFEPKGPASGGTKVVIPASDYTIYKYIDRVQYWDVAEQPEVEVRIGGKLCEGVQYESSNTALNGPAFTCFTPSGLSGTGPLYAGGPDDNVLSVTLEGVKATYHGNQQHDSNYQWSYWPEPSITMINPDMGFAAGGYLLTIDAFFEYYDFGPSVSASNVEVMVGNGVCANAQASNNNSQVTCLLPRSTPGTIAPVQLTMDGVQASNTLEFIYDPAPQLMSLSQDSGPSSGGNLLMINGDFFGNPGISVPMVFIGASYCVNPVILNTSTIACTVAPGTAGSAETVSVYIDGIAAGNTLTYTFNDAMVSAINGDGPTTGGSVINVSGSDFGVPGVTPVSVSIGGQACINPSLISETEITCTLPPGVGRDLAVDVTINGQVFNSLTFSYNPPSLLSSLPIEGNYLGGDALTLNGSNFGAADATVSIGGSPCVVNSQTHFEINCTTPSGVGVQAVVVEVGGQTSNGIPFTYGGVLPLDGAYKGMRLEGSQQ